MHEVIEDELDDITQPIMLFTPPNKRDPMELVNYETTPAENHQDNVSFPLHCTRPYLLHSTLIDALFATYEPPLYPHVDTSNDNGLASMADHPEVRFKAADYVLFGVYQGWVHQNSLNHLDGRIKKDSKWQDMWIKMSVCQPNAMTYHLVESGIFCLNPRSGS